MKINNFFLSALLALLLAPVMGWSAGAEVKLDKAPIDLEDGLSLQRGARLFVNYCLNCHSAAYMRYNRLTDLGLSEEDIEKYLVFTGAKVGSTMTVAMNADDAKRWFGAAPPDLTVIARSRGPDWLYTYLRTFYRDDSRALGWNNLTFPQVGMPHALWELQGVQVLKEEEVELHGEKRLVKRLVLAEPGKLSRTEYDAAVADLVNYLTYMGEPARLKRIQIGIVVILFLAVLFVLTYLLKKEFWKDVH
mgnify:CR=1 FL=1|jgi:ubiquinol-cytochrome c reductase cytochrome c1 subunit